MFAHGIAADADADWVFRIFESFVVRNFDWVNYPEMKK